MNIDSETISEHFRFNERKHLIVYMVWRTTEETMELLGVWTNEDVAKGWKKSYEKRDEEWEITSYIEVEERETDHLYAESMMKPDQFKRILAHKKAKYDNWGREIVNSES